MCVCLSGGLIVANVTSETQMVITFLGECVKLQKNSSKRYMAANETNPHTDVMYYTQTHTLYVYIHTSRCQKKKFKPVTLIRSHTHPHLQIN